MRPLEPTEGQHIEVEVQPGEQVVVVNPEKLALHTQILRGAGWFKTVGFFAVVNSLLIVANAKIQFIFALGITSVATAIAHTMDLGAGDEAIAMLFACLGAAGAYFFASFAQKRFTWAFVAGMVLYALDGLIFVLVQDWLEVFCHGYALLQMWGGLKASMEYNRRFPNG